MTDDRRDPRVSFIIPCLNEAESLGAVLQEIHSYAKTADLSYEIVVADNGSTDGSQSLAETNGARVVSVEERGYGAALLGGIAACHGTFAVMGDADGSYHFSDSNPMLDKLEDGYDLVVGNRFQGGIEKGAMPWLHRYVGNPALSSLGRLLYRVPLRDFHCGLRAFNVARIRSLNLQSPGMEFASEMIVAARRHKMQIGECPTTLARDLRSREPHLNTWRDGWRHLRFLFAFSPTWTFLTPSVLALIGACFVWFLSVSGPISAGDIELSYRSMLLAFVLTLLASVAAWSFLLAHVLVRTRPPAIRFRTEAAATGALLLFGIGTSVFILQFINWVQTGFGIQPVGDVLFAATGGALLMAIGGISLFFSLLVGLAQGVR